MIQHYSDLSDQLKNKEFTLLSGGQIQKIYSTAFYISISVRTPGKTFWLYLGRGGGHEGVWLYNSLPNSILRKRDAFLEYLRKFLVSSSFISLEIDEKDRLVKLNYQKYGHLNSFLFFWMARKLYFSHHFFEEKNQAMKHFFSWRESTKEDSLQENYFNFYDEVGRTSLKDLESKSSKMIEMKDLLNLEEALLSKSPQKMKKNFIERKEMNIKEDLRKAKQWEKLENFLKKKKELPNYELIIEDQKIKFSSNLNEYEKRNVIYEKIKKLKKGEKILSNRLGELLDLKRGDKKINETKSDIEVIKPVWKQVKKNESNNKLVSIDQTETMRFFNLEDAKIGLGLSAKGNDQLRNSWANKNDYWFHLDGYESTHLVVKSLQKMSFSIKFLEKVATIIACFSQFSGDQIPIVYTEIKNLRGVPGAQGMVTFKKEKRLLCLRDKEFEKIIKEGL